MSDYIDNISVNDDFWIMLKKHIITFRFQGMPKDIHFSVAYNNDSPDINLHVTRNTNNATNKPAIEIMRINNQELKALTPYLTSAFSNLILQPIDFKPIRRRNKRSHYGIHFYPLNNLPQSENISIETMLINEFKPLAKINKGRLKIKGDVEGRVKPLTTNATFLHTFENSFRWLLRKFSKQYGIGIIISKQFTGCAIHIKNKWYGIRKNINPINILHTCMEPALAKRLIFKTLMAYSRIKIISNYSESEKYNDSIRLYKILP